MQKGYAGGTLTGTQRLTDRQSRPTDALLYALVYICAAFSVLLLIGIIAYVLYKGVGAVNWQFLTSVTSVLKGTVGIAGNIVNTLLIILISMIIAMPGIITGVILAIGRIVGESAALLFTAGSAKTLPKTLAALLNKPFDSGGTLTIQLYLSATSEGDFDTAFGIAVVLLVLAFLINLGTKRLAARFDVRRTFS